MGVEIMNSVPTVLNFLVNQSLLNVENLRHFLVVATILVRRLLKLLPKVWRLPMVHLLRHLVVPQVIPQLNQLNLLHPSLPVPQQICLKQLKHHLQLALRLNVLPPILIDIDGDSMYPAPPVTILSQNTTHVEFKVENTFSYEATSIFTQYHSGSFGETECLEDENVES